MTRIETLRLNSLFSYELQACLDAIPVINNIDKLELTSQLYPFECLSVAAEKLLHLKHLELTSTCGEGSADTEGLRALALRIQTLHMSVSGLTVGHVSVICTMKNLEKLKLSCSHLVNYGSPASLITSIMASLSNLHAITLSAVAGDGLRISAEELSSLKVNFPNTDIKWTVK